MVAGCFGRRSSVSWKTVGLSSGLPHGYTLILEDSRLPAGNKAPITGFFPPFGRVLVDFRL
jgi:hypothetical protein